MNTELELLEKAPFSWKTIQRPLLKYLQLVKRAKRKYQSRFDKQEDILSLARGHACLNCDPENSY